MLNINFIKRNTVPITIFVLSIICLAAAYLTSNQATILSSIGIWLLFLSPLAGVISARKRTKFIWITGPICFLVFMAGLEIGLRTGPFEYRFLPSNTGMEYRAHPFLSWIPKSQSGLTPEAVTPHSGQQVPPKQGKVKKEPYMVSNHDPLLFRSGPVQKGKRPGVIRIILMGGSNAHGLGVEQYENTMAGVLAQRISSAYPQGEFEMILAAVKGYTLFHNLVFYKLFIREYKPDLVILYCNINDSSTSSSPYTYRELFKMRSGVDVGDLWITEHEFPKKGSSLLAAQDAMKKSKVYNFLTDWITDIRSSSIDKNGPPGTFKYSNPVSEYDTNLSDLIKILKSDGAELILADAFYYYNYKNPENYRRPNLIRQSMKEAAEGNQVLFVPIHDMISARKSPEDMVQYPDDPGHLNRAGHGYAATAIFEAANKNGLLIKLIDKADKNDRE